MHRLFLFASILILNGCALEAQRKDHFSHEQDAWVGRKADDLVVAKGPPSSTFAVATGEKVFLYSKSTVQNTGGGSNNVGAPVYKPGPNGAPGRWETLQQERVEAVTTTVQYCKLMFVIGRDNTIQSWKFDGNDCY